MGLFNSLTKLFRRDTQVGITSTTSSEDTGVSTTSSMPSVEVSVTSSVVKETPAMPTADEINIAFEEAAQADRLAIERDFLELKPDPPVQKKKTAARKPSSKTPRKSTSKRKKS